MAKIPNAEEETKQKPVAEEVKRATATLDKSGDTNKIEITLNEKAPDRSFVVHKSNGGKIIAGGDEPTVFLSRRRELSLFTQYNSYLHFKHHRFETNDPETISYIRKHGLFGIEIFEGVFPQHIKDIMEEERRYITRDAEIFNVNR